MSRFPSGVQAFVAWARSNSDLASLIGGSTGPRVGVDLDATLPAIRVQLISGNPEVSGESLAARPVIQVECWGRSTAEADQLMWTLIGALKTLRYTTWTSNGLVTYVAWVDVQLGPLVSDDEPAGAFRQLVDLELSVYVP